MRKKSLAEVSPDLLVQWSPDNELSPSAVSYGSNKKVLWFCDKGHTWPATVKNRVLADCGCPYCEHRAVLRGYNDLQTLVPEVAAAWSPNNRLKPYEVSPKSNTEVLWLCENGHEWKARVADRTNGHGCPYCAGQRVWKGFNDLATTHPALIPEWSDKNSISPDTITYKNRSNVWWHCSKCGNDYQAVVYARANGRICPFCIAKALQELREHRQIEKKINKDFSYLLPQLAAIYYAGKNGLRVITDSDELTGISIMVLIPDISLAIDVCTSEHERTVKEYICSAHKISYICLSEKQGELETLNCVRRAFTNAHLHLHTVIEDDLETLRKRYSLWKKKGLND